MIDYKNTLEDFKDWVSQLMEDQNDWVIARLQEHLLGHNPEYPFDKEAQAFELGRLGAFQEVYQRISGILRCYEDMENQGEVGCTGSVVVSAPSHHGNAGLASCCSVHSGTIDGCRY